VQKSQFSQDESFLGHDSIATHRYAVPSERVLEMSMW